MIATSSAYMKQLPDVFGSERVKVGVRVRCRVTIFGKAKIGTMDGHFARDQIYGLFINFFNKIGTFKFSSRPDL